MNKPIAYLGIDPGVTGAIALIHPDGQVVEDWPGDEVAAVNLIRFLALQYDIRRAAIEDMGTGPFKGKLAFVKLSENKGIWRGILASHGIPFRLVWPQQWQKGIVPPKSGKEGSLAVARRLFPNMDLHRRADHNRAEALLIAEYVRRRG